MRLELSLNKKHFVWALVHPMSREHIKITNNERGYQKVNLIFTQQYPGPVEVELEDFPTWAQKQILSAVKSGQLINTGDKIEPVLEPEKLDKPAKAEGKSTGKGSKKAS